MNVYSNQCVNVGLAGAGGYVGNELIRLIDQHPHLKLVHVLKREEPKPNRNTSPPFDLLVLATPPETSMKLAHYYSPLGIPIIDLSGAFRLSEEEFNAWYGLTHSANYLIKQSVYGLSPWQSITHSDNSTVLANPGCYATCALMALLPLLKNKIIDPENIIIDAKSGISGAGKSLKEEFLFCEVAQNFYPYKVGIHQHTPEINKAIFEFTQFKTEVTLTTQILPLIRGISMSIYASHSLSGSDSMIKESIKNAYDLEYKDYPLIQIGEMENNTHLHQLKNVINKPNTHIIYHVKNQKIIIFSLIDNLLKGAASQAIENINHIYHWPVNMGLNYGKRT